MKKSCTKITGILIDFSRSRFGNDPEALSPSRQRLRYLRPRRFFDNRPALKTGRTVA